MQVDLASVLIPLVLRRRFLEHIVKEILPLKAVLRCSWIPPNLAGATIVLPPDTEALGVIGRICHKLYKVRPTCVTGRRKKSLCPQLCDISTLLCLASAIVRDAVEPRKRAKLSAGSF